MRLSQAARTFNLNTKTLLAYLHSQGMGIDDNPNTKITPRRS